ncbi:Tripartite tricarboxylate transporter TctB family protein [Paracoccus haematequi]|uniref:Tripartite tricarboxylate transporter TctB family protein n=1 Tax=Paracoccus haematequi TaxID=2491866 RepID=A0A447ILD4_9RHOB|nr:tripartite tricarboxylate transporter TctB family protein [Paracoccus haematequi]VDS08179.1 Tripartite tricarboxylate transporter TctB family protein [Paracoccus haematequi]
MSTKPKDGTDIAAGLLFMAIAAFFAWQSLGLEMGTSTRMGPGYFPIVLSGLLFLLGAIILVKAFGRPDDESFGRIAWRGILFILPAPIFFGLTVRGLGFVPALFITTLIASQASMRMRPLAALILAIIVTIMSTLIFSYGLGLPFRRFGPWLPV